MSTDKRAQISTDKSFTLMELLIAVSIFSVIALCLYSVFSGGIRIWQRQEQGFRYSHSIRLALDRMAKELRNAINYSQPEKAGLETSDEQNLLFLGEAKKVSFMTLIGGEIAKVSYVLEEGADQKGILKRKIVFQKEGFKDENQKEEIVIGDLDGLLFEYAYETGEKNALPEWKDSWEGEGKIPRGVKITLEFQKEILRKLIFIPTGAPEKL